MHYLVIPYFSIFLFFLIAILNKNNKSLSKIAIVSSLLIGILFFLFALIFQPLEGDSYRYSVHFYTLSTLSFEDLLKLDSPEFAYRILNWTVGHITQNFHFFIFILFSLVMSIYFKALKNIYPTFEKYFIFSAMLLYPYLISYVVSGKRQGIALALMLLAISYIFLNKKIKALLALAIIPLFHFSSIIILPFILIFMFFKEKNIFKISITIFTISVLVSLFGINEFILGTIPKYINLSPSQITYFEKGGEFAYIDYRTGFRLDFALFSFFPIFLYLFFRKKIIYDKNVIWWLSIYMLLNSLYHILSILPFNDRFSAFSWFILPIVSYEILKKANKRYAKLFIIGVSFLNIILLQFYTAKYFPSLGIF